MSGLVRSMSRELPKRVPGAGIIAVLSLIVMLPGCTANSGFATRDFTRSGYGSARPLTVNHAALAGEPGWSTHSDGQGDGPTGSTSGRQTRPQG